MNATAQNKVNIVQLTQAQLMDETGRDIPVSSLWQNQKAIFIFLRHFACLACRAHAKQVWDDREKYQKNGAKIYFVGSGGVNFIDSFKEEHGITEPIVYTDLTLETFRACGFKRGFLVSHGPRSIVNYVKMIGEGHKFDPTKYKKGAGDLWQLGGVLAVGRNGKVLYHYISEALGDFPPEKGGEEISLSDSEHESEK